MNKENAAMVSRWSARLAHDNTFLSYHRNAIIATVADCVPTLCERIAHTVRTTLVSGESLGKASRVSDELM